MDCVIPGHSVRQFCASLVCLSKIGKDIYIEFDPVEGLALRALNDAKSAYSCFKFDASFFERCTAATASTATGNDGRKNKNKKRSHDNDLAGSQSQSQEQRFSARVAVRALAPIVRPRKDVVSLRLRSEISSSALFVSFEFQIHQKTHDTLICVVHRIKAADADAVSAVATKESSSEIVTSPKVLTRLLEPLKRTVEAALVVRKDTDIVTAASFHHTDTTVAQSNDILQTASATLLKTETGISCTEFEEFFFRDDRSVRGNEDGENSDAVVPVDMPDDVNDGVILVFPIKECKAMLQFCSHVAQVEPEPRQISVFYHWGGRPLLFETNGEGSTAELVLATLDYKLLAPQSSTNNTSNNTAAAGGGGSSQ